MATHGLPAWPWAGLPTDELPPAERLLLDALRQWSAAARNGQPIRPALERLLVTEDATLAAAPLDALLRRLAAWRSLGLGCPLCPRITPDEAVLLLSCALAQRGGRREALATLLRWLPPAAAYAAMPGALHLGAALRCAGVLLDNPLRATARRG